MSHDRERRRVLRALAGLPLVGLSIRPGDAALFGKVPESSAAGSPTVGETSAPRALVARCRREGVLGEGVRLDPKLRDEVLGRAVSRAAGEENPVAALRRLFRKTDRVGIKVSTLAGRRLSPHPDLVLRLTEWLQEAGVPARNILIWDRTDLELKRAGFEIVRSGGGVRCFGTNQDYDWSPREWGPGGSCFARFLVDDLTALINFGVLKDHDLSGVSIGLKNWYGAIHNPNKFHDDNCAPFIPHLAAFPLIREKARLTVIDATTAQCHGGPARNPRWSWPYEAVLASTDPVALESVGRAVIETRREEMGLPTLAAEKREPVWIADAGALGLGEADPARIRVEDL